MNEDYKDFLSGTESPSDTTSKNILDLVSEDLKPSPFKIFGKLTGVHGFVGILTMLFCPQFNLSLTNNYELFHYFHMNFGHAICMFICGSIFLGTGSLFALSILSREEVRKIRKTKALYHIALSIFATFIFSLIGTDVYLSFVIFWILGAVVSGFLFFEIAARTSDKFLKSI